MAGLVLMILSWRVRRGAEHGDTAGPFRPPSPCNCGGGADIAAAGKSRLRPTAAAFDSATRKHDFQSSRHNRSTWLSLANAVKRYIG